MAAVADDALKDGVPKYADALRAFHEGFRAELEALVAALPLAAGMRVLDMACGDGFYTELLRACVGPTGLVVGLDNSLPYLCEAEDGPTLRKPYICGALECMPFERESFDFVWCAQSLYSLPDPVRALELLRPMLRRGGLIGVLENDSMHEVLMPWPVSLELAVRAAERQAMCMESAKPNKYYVGRELSSVLARAGFEPVGLRTQVIDRATPLGAAEEFFVQNYIVRLLDRVGDRLDDHHRQMLQSLGDEQSPQYLLGRRHVTISWMNILAIARRND
ncbi:MAG TPA: class I SAM-dependent methyltransferase [Pirellulales bacterium]|nr:class I SAM-dependent methyltransferase [Pirellulales bacterium]